MSEKIEVVNNAAKVGEGPHWDERTQSLYYVDMSAGNVIRYTPANGSADKLDMKAAVSSVVIPRERGGFIISRDTEIVAVDTWDTADIKTIASFPEPEVNMMNDGKVDTSGRLWIGSCYDGRHIPSLDDWPKERGSLYSVDPDGTVKKHLDKITISNGMGWNCSDNIMYYIDSVARKIYAFDFDSGNCTIDNQRTSVDFSGTALSEFGYPDGMTVDAADKVWLACYMSSKVFCLDPETGKVIRTVKLPVEKPSSCCFGGPDYSDLYVTSVKTSDGSLYRVSGLGVKGRKPNIFAG